MRELWAMLVCEFKLMDDLTLVADMVSVTSGWGGEVGNIRTFTADVNSVNSVNSASSDSKIKMFISI